MTDLSERIEAIERLDQEITSTLQDVDADYCRANQSTIKISALLKEYSHTSSANVRINFGMASHSARDAASSLCHTLKM